VALARFPLPDRKVRERATVRAWDAWWSDPVSVTWTVGDRPLLLELADAYDRRAVALRRAMEDPIVPGRNDQPVASPWFSIAEQALASVQEAYKQLGIGPLNKSRLGVMILTERKTLDDLNADFNAEMAADLDAGVEWRDPRLMTAEEMQAANERQVAEAAAHRAAARG
jgi:hypothetical protein